jgi:hypothetical protein
VATTTLGYLSSILSWNSSKTEVSFDHTRLPRLLMMLKTYSTISSMKHLSFSSENYEISKLEFELPKLAVVISDSESKPICRIRFDDWKFSYTYKPCLLKHSVVGHVQEMTLLDGSQESQDHPMHMLINTRDVSRFGTNSSSSNSKSPPAFEFKCTYTEADRTIESNINKSKYAFARIDLRAAPFYFIFNRRTIARFITVYTYRDFHWATKVPSFHFCLIFQKATK